MMMCLRDALATLYRSYDSNQLAERYTAAAKLVSEEERRHVRGVGDRVPPFDVNHPEKGRISSRELLDKGPLIVNFYRGLWCSYCQRDLLGVEEAFPRISAANAFVIAITRGLNSGIRTKLTEATSISFPMVDDTDGLIAERFGLRWSARDADMIDAAMGMDLVTLRGTGPWIFPMQARYMIQQDGVIGFANVAFDYDQRTEPAAVLPALARLAASGKR
jgi:peroxiredoxin